MDDRSSIARQIAKAHSDQMRRPHVFERSAPRPGKDGYQEPAGKAVAARTIAAQLGNMLDRATAADLPTLVELLEAARAEAEKLAASES